MGDSTGGGAGGFVQSPNPFGGMNNTDLRPVTRRKRPVRLLNTTWPIAGKKKDRAMRKEFETMLDLLKTSVIEIAESGADDRTGLLVKSLNEFSHALNQKVDEIAGPEPEMLEKGLNHCSVWASALNQLNRTAQALKEGRPSYMLDNGGNEAAPLPKHIVDDIDRTIQAGVFALKEMVNETIEMPIDDEEMQRAEQQGQLVKFEGEIVGDLLIKSSLPESMLQYLEDPVVLMAEAVEIGRSFLDRSRDAADVLMKGELIPEDVMVEFPEIFEPLNKAPPPRKKPVAMDMPISGGTDDVNGDGSADQGDGEEPLDDESGADYDTENDEDGSSGGMPQDPLATAARLASMLLLILGAMMEGQKGASNDLPQANDTFAGDPNDPANVGMQRSEPAAFIPMRKILNGEVEISEGSAVRLTGEDLDLLEELVQSQEQLPELLKTIEQKDEALEKLRTAYDRLSKTPMPMPGPVRQPPVAVTKQQDGPATGVSAEDVASKIQHLQKVSPEGDRSAAELIKMVHAQGGRPLDPMQNPGS